MVQSKHMHHESAQEPATDVGLKIGLEIHQQVGRPGDTKLFCRCPAEIVEREPDLIVTRLLRASAGETGQFDAAAAAEAAKEKQFIYQAHRDATCLVELDEEPPHVVNETVVETAVMIAKACKSVILPQVQFMRKTIVDGSATSGFQRTGLLALGGVVPQGNDLARVRIQTICVEEDAAKIVTRTAGVDTYNLSRLGIPLIEIATEPDITTAEQAKEVAAQLGMLLRSTRRVKRGLGTIRQDLNISIKGGSRIEIKGCQDLRMIPTLVHYEVARQQTLLRLVPRMREVASHIKQTRDSSENLRVYDATELFKTSTVPFVRKALVNGSAIGKKLAGAAGLLGTELCPNYRLGSDLADLARSAGFGGMIHGDEDLKKYGIDPSEIRSAMHCGPDDTFIILLGAKEQASRTLNVIEDRIVLLSGGIPKEVRKANPDGTTSFLRPMPGASRMYPETDIPLVIVNTHGVAAPKLLSEQAKDLAREYKISEDQAKELVREGLPFEELCAKFNIDAVFIATALLTYGKEIMTRFDKEIDHVALLDPLLKLVAEEKIQKSAVFEILVEIAQGNTLDNLDLKKYEQLNDDELLKIIISVLQEHPDGKPNLLMGQIMKQVRGRADGVRIKELLAKQQTE